MGTPRVVKSDAAWPENGGMLRIRFLKRSGVNYAVEFSANLTEWTGGLTSEPMPVQPDGLPEGYMECEASMPTVVGGRFMRVGVSIP